MRWTIFYSEQNLIVHQMMFYKIDNLVISRGKSCSDPAIACVSYHVVWKLYRYFLECKGKIESEPLLLRWHYGLKRCDRLGPFQEILLLHRAVRSAENITLSTTRNGLLPRKGEEEALWQSLATKNWLTYLIFLLLLLIFLLLLLRLLFFPGLDPGGEISQDGKRTKWA